MTAKVFDFSAMKQQGAKKSSKTSPTPEKHNKLYASNYEIFADVYEDVIGEWQLAASKNALNEYILSKIPSFARVSDDADYVNDLNTIAEVEKKLNMQVVMFYPGTVPENAYGWMTGFHRGKEVFSSPPDMASEANSRALNILLFLAFNSHLKKLGRD